MAKQNKSRQYHYPHNLAGFTRFYQIPRKSPAILFWVVIITIAFGATGFTEATPIFSALMVGMILAIDVKIDDDDLNPEFMTPTQYERFINPKISYWSKLYPGYLVGSPNSFTFLALGMVLPLALNYVNVKLGIPTPAWLSNAILPLFVALLLYEPAYSLAKQAKLTKGDFEFVRKHPNKPEDFSK